jgi:hypothetical protein
MLPAVELSTAGILLGPVGDSPFTASRRYACRASTVTFLRATVGSNPTAMLTRSCVTSKF